MCGCRLSWVHDWWDECSVVAHKFGGPHSHGSSCYAARYVQNTTFLHPTDPSPPSLPSPTSTWPHPTLPAYFSVPKITNATYLHLSLKASIHHFRPLYFHSSILPFPALNFPFVFLNGRFLSLHLIFQLLINFVKLSLFFVIHCLQVTWVQYRILKGLDELDLGPQWLMLILTWCQFNLLTQVCYLLQLLQWSSPDGLFHIECSQTCFRLGQLYISSNLRVSSIVGVRVRLCSFIIGYCYYWDIWNYNFLEFIKIQG